MIIPDLQAVARGTAVLDICTSLAEIAQVRDYTHPILNSGDGITILDGRHPVVEQGVSGSFVPNDTNISSSGTQVMIITGSNMAGKSAHLHDMSGAKYIRTTNGGITWGASSIPDAASLIACNMTAVDENNAWIVFDSTSGSTTCSGIFRTTNGGTSWEKQITARDPFFVYFFDNSNGLVVGNPEGGYWAIYTTSNSGNTWTRVPSANIPSPISGEMIEPGGAPCGFGNSFWFASLFGNGILYRTTDKGLTWSKSQAIPGAVGMAVAFESELVGLISSDDPAVYRHTTDGGQTFNTVGNTAGITPHYLRAIPGSPGAYMMTTWTAYVAC